MAVAGGEEIAVTQLLDSPVRRPSAGRHPYEGVGRHIVDDGENQNTLARGLCDAVAHFTPQ